MVKSYRKIKVCWKANCRNEVLVGSNYCVDHQVKPESKLMVNNPEGHNQSTPKSALVKHDPVLRELEVFKKLAKCEQESVIHNLGNEIWRKSKDFRAKKAKFTRMQHMFFGWNWSEEE